MKRLICVLFLLCASSVGFADALKTKNVVLITLDGLRWQELFRGVDETLAENETFVKNKAAVAQFRNEDTSVSRQNLMPFMWQSVAQQGVLIGNRDRGSAVSLTNEWYFSYPGYSEILCGYADNRIDSNKPVWNPNVTVLEWLNQPQRLDGGVAAFGSWDVFPYIINSQRSKIPVNAGFAKAAGDRLSPREQLLNDLQPDTHSPWHNVRLDVFTHHYALEYMRREQPSVVYIAYGETDDFAHDGRYDFYLQAAHRADKFIADVWRYLQSTPKYKNSTTLIISTDHGRGSEPVETWQHHASAKATKGYLGSLKHYPKGIVGSEQTWIAAIGPDTPARGAVTESGPYYSDQIAATVAALLGFDYGSAVSKAGHRIDLVLPED